MLQSRMIQLVQMKSLRIQPVQFLKSMSHGLSRKPMYNRGHRVRPVVTVLPTSVHTSHRKGSAYSKNLKKFSTVIQLNLDKGTMGVTVKKTPFKPNIKLEVVTIIVWLSMLVVLFTYFPFELSSFKDQGAEEDITYWKRLMHESFVDLVFYYGARADGKNLRKLVETKVLKGGMANAVKIGQAIVEFYQSEVGIPGISVAVSVDGETVWEEGFGYADAEKKVPYSPDTQFYISAGLHSSFLMVAVAKLWEEGKLDLDKPVQHYVPEFPEKTWYGKKVNITTRQLVRDMGGIRQVGVMPPGKNFEQDDPANLDCFKDDPLIVKPGTYFRSDFGWTLVKAIIQKVTQLPCEEYLRKVIEEMGLKNTRVPSMKYFAESGRNDSQIPAKRPISNVFDLVTFGNAMLCSHQNCSCPTRCVSKEPSVCLNSKTVAMLWQMRKDCVDSSQSKTDIVVSRGMGWVVLHKPTKLQRDHLIWERFPSLISSDGDSTGCSALAIIPAPDSHRPMKERLKHPRGIVISIQANSEKSKIINVVGALCLFFMCAYMAESYKSS